MNARRLTYYAAERAALDKVELPPLEAAQIRVSSLFTGISRGTESLVFSGKVPESEWQRMACPHQAGSFDFPISYGYSAVGKVIECGSAIKSTLPGDIIFALHPHQDVFQIDAEMANVVPEEVSAHRACLTANMETALNAWWDSGATPDHKTSVVGAGVVGLLSGYVAQKHSDHPVEIIDIDEKKAPKAKALGLTFKTPAEAEADRSVIFHTSASANGLQTAIDLTAFEGKVVEMSWYGDKPISISLGGHFHAGRIAIQSSQVGHVSPSRRATTTYKDRMAKALTLLADPALDHLLEDPIAFDDLPDALPALFSPQNSALCQLISYGD